MTHYDVLISSHFISCHSHLRRHLQKGRGQAMVTSLCNSFRCRVKFFQVALLRRARPNPSRRRLASQCYVAHICSFKMLQNVTQLYKMIQDNNMIIQDIHDNTVPELHAANANGRDLGIGDYWRSFVSGLGLGMLTT